MKRYKAVIFFDGPLSKWKRAPDHREVLTEKEFRFSAVAEAWAKVKTRDLDNVLFQIDKL